MSSWSLIWADPLYRLVVLVCVAQLGLLACLVVVISGIRAARRRFHTVSERVVQEISALLFAYLAGATRVDEFVAAVTKYSVHQVAITLERYTPALAGREQEAIGTFSARSGLIEAGARLCRSWLWWRRLEGARILGAAATRDIAHPLLPLLDDRSLVVRLAAARAIGRTQDPAYIEPLLRALQRGSLARTHIAEVLAGLGSESRERLRELVMQLPPGPRTSVLRATSIEVLALVGDAGATPFIQYALASGDTEVRIAAFKAACHVRARLSHDDVRAGLGDGAWQVRAQAARLVGRNQMLSLAREAALMLSDTSWWVRIAAARALVELGPIGVDLLESAGAAHADPYARGIALRVLTEDPGYSAIAQLRDKLARRDGAATAAEA